MGELKIIVERAQDGNKNCTLIIIEKFRPLINKYSKKLNYSGANSDLIICLIEVIRDMPIAKNPKFKEDKYIVGYIYTSIKRKYVQLYKEHLNIISRETELNLNVISDYYLDESWNLIDSRIFILSLMNKLSQYQKYIIKKIFLYDFSVSDLANELNISRQSVNRAKNRALNNLRKYAVE
ncbi:sigma-70 family RNA polymerase sigma factor [Clostridium tyrobutyricum]|uniref:sigma-70 family RNA polymerase sigma factor n=1 Tax=Clostridium tyrobutyricum TaxID=1519 RepID=UPI0010AA7ACD|nr:sigma-70 family RNA polymerase sigma factor [Clostridium tyrobutyricum]QCH29051.1 Bacteriocin UviA [Clostridium tyrobutyricum]